MKRKLLFPLILLTILVGVFFLPDRSYAVDYNITNVIMEAQLQENGKVSVTETHTYEFDGKFSGITREIVPKKGSAINEFQAMEDGKSLKIEQDDHLYKIHRKGSDETITVELTYLIEGGVNIYQDIAEFYWPFFDDRNEVTYEQLEIIVHPPTPTSDVIAFGYDQAFQTEHIGQDGTVIFQLGEVPDGKNGDIRVAYDVTLFPSAAVTANKPMKSEILETKQNLIDAAVARAQAQEQLRQYGGLGILLFALILFVLILRTSLQARRTRRNVEQSYENHSFFVPKQVMSLSATISYTNGRILPSEAMAAALLDLVRKGIVKKTGNNGFRLANRQTDLLEHEQILIELLFDKIGSNGEFNFEELNTFTKNKNNHQTFQTYKMKWAQAVGAEVRQHDLYEDKKKYRTIIGLSSLLLIPMLIIFPVYGLPAQLFFTILLFITVLIYAFAYHPKTTAGHQLSYEWRIFKTYFKDLAEEDWKSLTEDERMRAYLYGLGVNQKQLTERNEVLVESFKPSIGSTPAAGMYGPVDISTIAFFGPIASSTFHSVDQTTQSTTNSSSSTGGGGGVGGGGGGSGAF
ncbi:DUF2207 domain-containing protein [Bacillus sp. PS06]|uniref:DUF2207 domain-containing protein n=1 Tax=Bacillus sp. PS06 TaxID=2764176 RepID=UPI00177FA00C|nr:DUF2207 domain-containing protein [Bacillus sp. PS06]MBD8071157.1 DUF2207 domain-containing protein [Bacillus sp. PS06]